MGIVRRLAIVSAALLLVLANTSAVGAAMAVIETTAELTEHSDEAVQAAVLAALETAARGAKAMGFTQMTVKGVRVLPEMVVVQALAVDADSGAQDGNGDNEGSARGEGSSVKGRL
jgi:hypothetical protein